MIEKLKEKWGINNSFQFIIVMIVFGVTGSAAAIVSEPITTYFNLHKLNFFSFEPTCFKSISLDW